MIREVLADGSIDRGGAFQSIPRPRVQARLAEACAERVALIVAPAGYGKSVALNAYLESLTTPYVRYDVDESGSTLSGFVRGFVESIREIAPTAPASLADALRSVVDSDSAGSSLAKWLHAHVKTFGGTIIVDDFHKSADDHQSSQFLASLIEKTKSRIKWLVATRSTLDLPVASWLAYGTSGMAIDEHDLGFSIDEARSAAKNLRLAVRDEELVALLELTRGWPTAVVFSLRSSTRSNDLKNIAATTREMIYRYLAEQVYQAMPDAARDFLRDASLLARLDVTVLQAMGYDRAEWMLEELRHAVAFISVDAPGHYRIHDLFRDFLDYQSRMLGNDNLKERIRKVAAALESSNRQSEALALYKRADDHESIVRIIETAGFEISAQGGNAALESAIVGLPSEIRAKNPAVVGLRAMFQEDRQRFAEAERLFRKALTFPLDARLRARFALSLNALLTTSGKTDAIPLLEDEALIDHEDPEIRIDVRGALSMSYSIAGRFDEAREMVDSCLDLLEEVDDPARARALSRLSVSYYYFGEFQSVDRYATEGAALSAEIGLFSTAARCFSSLYATSSMRSDNTQALWYAQQMATAATKSANKVMHSRALFSIVDIESQRGNNERVESTLRAISETFGRDSLNEPFVVLEALALQAAWNGSFERALQYLQSSLKSLFDPSHIAMRRSLIALFAAALDRRDEALDQLAQVGAFIDEAVGSHDRLGEFAIVFSSLANVSLGRTTVARKQLKVAYVQTAVAQAMKRLVLECADSPTASSTSGLEVELRSIQEAGFGGYAMMLRALPIMNPSGSADFVLTPTEQSVLLLLDRGMRPKAIAESTGRSVHTIQNHIRSVISKLGTSGRSEALVVARQRGMI